MTNGQVRKEPLKLEWAEKFIGGKGLGIRYLFDLLPAHVDPLSPDNAIILMTGPLTGTIASTMSRMANVTKSPLSETLSDSHSGGYFPAELKFAGFDGVIIEGRSSKPVYLSIKDEQAEIRDASHLWGKGVFETNDLIIRESGEKPRHPMDGPKVGCIGVAGENRVRFAAIAYETHHFAGRGGTGAVMGSKNLKAISVRGTRQTKSLNINSEASFQNAVREIIKKDIRENPSEEMLMRVGTPGIVALSQAAGLLPTRNFQSGVFERADQIDADAMADKILVKHVSTCYSCSIGCRNITKVKDGEYAGLEAEGPEYETLALCGSNLGINDIRVITKFNEDCSDYGLDTISTGNVCGWAVEAYERGALTKEEVGELELKFGSPAIGKLPKMIAFRQGIGNLLAEGVARASRRIGGDTAKYAMHVKGLEYPGYDPRGTFGMALAYATADRGADHNRAWPVGYDAFGKFDPFTPDRKAELVYKDQIRTSVKWSLEMCDFLAANLSLCSRLLNLTCDTKFDEETISVLGRRIWTMTRLFNMREGFSKKDDTMPPRIQLDPLPEGVTKGRFVSQQAFDKMLTEYYRLWGWDEDGAPTPTSIDELGLSDLQ